MFRSKAYLALTLATALFVAACGGAAQTAKTVPASAPSGGAHKIQGSLVYASSSSPVNFNPILASDTVSSFVIDRVFTGLIQVDEKLNVVPDLATEWTSSENGLEWTFKLRQDVKFHDGKPFTAEDVAYTYNAIKDKGYTGPRSSDFSSLDRVDVVDPYTVKFVLNEPFAPLLSSLDYGILPKHLYADKPVAEMKDNPANRKPVGTGPWQFGEWVAGQYIALTRNDDFYAEGPYIPEVRLKFVQDTNVATAQLEAGEIDLLALPSAEVKRITGNYADQLNFYRYEALSFQYMGINTTRPGLNDKAVRQAMAYAVDRERIVSDILEGEAVVMHTPFPTASWAYTDNLKKYEFDAQKAMQTLEAAGYRKGADGIYAKDGVRLSYTLLARSGSGAAESIVLMIQKNLKDIGIEIKADFVEWSVMLEKHLWVGNMDLWLAGFSLDEDPDQFVLFHSSQAQKNEKGRFVGFNRAQYSNAEVDRLLEAGRKEMDQAKRKALYEQYQQIIAEDVPSLFLYNTKTTFAMKKKVGGVIISPIGPMNSQRWYIDQP